MYKKSTEKHIIKTISKPHKNINNLLRPLKDNPGVYEIQYICGSVYIGETKLFISTSLKEHFRSTRDNDITKSAVDEHSDTTKLGVLCYS